MATAAETYASMVRASRRAGRSESRPPREENVSERWSPGASRFREDPFRENETLQALLSFIDPEDTVLDVGGGAGRYLPLAFHCKEFVNVEPAAGMGAQFEAAVKEAGISNARWLQSDWFEAEIEGDVTFCANVVYYVENIEPFVERLHKASRRRVMIVMHSVPPTNIGAKFYRYVNEAELPLAPSHRELLPVLWEMGLLPEVCVLGPSDFIAERVRYQSREEAIESVLPGDRGLQEIDAIRSRIDEHFDELFSLVSGGYIRGPIGTDAGTSRVLLITWDTRRNRSWLRQPGRPREPAPRASASTGLSRRS